MHNKVYCNILHFYQWHLKSDWLFTGKAKIGKMSRDLQVKYELLESAHNTVLVFSFLFDCWWLIWLQCFFPSKSSFWNSSSHYCSFLQYLRYLCSNSHCSWRRIVWNELRNIILILSAHEVWGMWEMLFQFLFSLSSNIFNFWLKNVLSSVFLVTIT